MTFFALIGINLSQKLENGRNLSLKHLSRLLLDKEAEIVHFLPHFLFWNHIPVDSLAETEHRDLQAVPWQEVFLRRRGVVSYYTAMFIPPIKWIWERRSMSSYVRSCSIVRRYSQDRTPYD